MLTTNPEKKLGGGKGKNIIARHAAPEKLICILMEKMLPV
jgi:hypothetical protein